MIGPRIGAKVGPMVGARIGSGVDELAPQGGTYSVDATSNIAVPANSTEWSNFNSAKSLTTAVPDALWLMQEASGDMLDSIGSFTLAASGTGLAYQQAVAGWARKAITFTDAGTGSFKSTSASLPDISVASQLTVFILNITMPVASRKVIGQGTTVSAMNMQTTGKVLAISGANSLGAANVSTGSVRAFAVRTLHGVSTTVYSDSEKTSPTFGSPTGKTVFLGSNGATSPTMAALYGMQWHGANAEMSDASLKALLQAMGFTITWT